MRGLLVAQQLDDGVHERAAVGRQVRLRPPHLRSHHGRSVQRNPCFSRQLVPGSGQSNTGNRKGAVAKTCFIPQAMGLCRSQGS